MSQWTHVCGCIRADFMDGVETISRENKIKSIKTALGNIVNFSDEDWETTAPLGSEGSIKYQIIDNPEKHHLAAFVIPIWGDLRDYENVDEIEKWFIGACDKIGFIRDAVIHIDVEFKEDKTIVYNKTDDDNE